MIGVCSEGHEQISYLSETCPLCQVLKAMAELILIIDKGDVQNGKEKN